MRDSRADSRNEVITVLRRKMNRNTTICWPVTYLYSKSFKSEGKKILFWAPDTYAQLPSQRINKSSHKPL